MPFFDFLRNLFSPNDRATADPRRSGDYLSRDSFRNPVWQNDEEDDDEEDIDFRRLGKDFHFRIVSDPFEIMRVFESHIDQSLKHIFSGFGSHDQFFSSDGDFFKALPAPEQQPRNYDDLRSQVLKRDQDSLKFSPLGDQKRDIDLDGKISPQEFSKFWNDRQIQNDVQLTPRSSFVQKFVKREFVRRQDGTMEQREIIRDSQGNEETKISRQIGDKKHIVSIKKDKNGVETKSEDVINMDENELNNFNEKWTSSAIQTPNRDTNNRFPSDFPWDKFFGPNPKL